MKLLRILSIAMALMMDIAIHAAEKTVNGQPYVLLNNDIWMPRFGIGTYNVPGDSTAQDAVSYALKCGYRHIDTAHAYRVERGVGEAVKEIGIPRGEIWITSKLWPSEYGEGKTMEAIDKMLQRLQTDYIDLLYVHQPMGDFRGAWKDMEKAVKQGKVRALGISNFDAADSLFHAPTIQAIAKAHGKTPAQIIIRWHIQEVFSVIPGATRHDYIKENISVFDFKLTDEEMAKMRALNKEKRFFNMDYKQAEQFMLNWKIDD